MSNVKRPVNDERNDRRRRTLSEINSQNESRHTIDPNQGPKHKRNEA
jgi:hypothetical protein